jgi:tetratricopeptide (TPR) repeat protein
VAEIGGRVRITAEVVDPHTQTTVYSESADGTGAESVLGSLDTINGRLRERLGEALATVSSDSLPLEKVATKNLDALRAYSIATRNHQRGKLGEALELYRQALSIDPQFSAVQMRIGAIEAGATRNLEAEAAFKAALADELDRMKLFLGL